MSKLFNALALWHGALPYYPGKWRVGAGLAQYCSFPEQMQIRRRGTVYRLDTRVLPHRQLLTDGVYEAAETAFVKRRLKPGMVVADIGANIGYYTLLCSRLVGPAGHVHAFEPTPRTYALLSENLRLNPNCTNVELRNCAMGDRAGHFHLVESAAYSGSGTNHMTACDGGTETISLDSLALPRLDFIKLDVEGFEMRVLQGAHDTLRRCRPLLLVEVNVDALQQCGDSAAAVVDFLAGLGYQLWHPTWRGLKAFRMPGPGEWPNLVALPASAA